MCMEISTKLPAPVSAPEDVDLERARASYARQAWREAYDRLSAAERANPLGPEDLELLGTAAYLTGRRAESVDIWARVHNEYLRRGGAGDRARAARWACWLAFRLLIAGERARGGGWLARGSRLLEGCDPTCLEQGCLLLPQAMSRVLAGDPAGGRGSFHEAAALGERHGDRDLVAMARLGEGRTLVRLGDAAGGLGLLDEVMAAVDAREVSPVLVGDIYCAVISACGEVFDLRRAQEWTAALSHWCNSQPEIAPHQGECLVRRSEILRLHGSWSDALAEARRACDIMPEGDPATGAACYQVAELRRLRGELDEAEADYRAASRAGRSPQPGLSLLRLAQGQSAAASAGIRQALEDSAGGPQRAALLAAAVEIGLAAGDDACAASAAEELSALAGRLDAPFLQALSASATGAVLLAGGDAHGARQLLRVARALWQEIGAPYEAARVRVLLGRACAELGEAESAELELDAAAAAFEQLEAATDSARLAAVREAARPAKQPHGGLTERELEVLALVAEGISNRAIAGRLFISEKTVARHVSNIFGKLGLSTRAAATSYAYRHGLLQGRG